MLEEARLRWLVTEERLKLVLPAFAGEVIVLDSDWTSIAQLPSSNLEARKFGLSPDHLAYAVFTSGSAGRPKAVMVEHRSVVNLVQWGCAILLPIQARRCSALLSLSFDASVLEIWSALCVGAALVIAPAQTVDNPEALLQWWASQRLDASILPTPLADSAFARAIQNPTVNMLLVGGDQLRGLPSEESSCLVINNYGPTEATVVATSGAVYRDDDVLHIGRPIANTQIFILDRHQQLAPVGVEGEIYIGGAAVARGYVNKAALTAERFVPNPFSADRGRRMYRTGDLARWRADGTLEFLGRNDRQVKIRGYRVELSEIEHYLASCTGVASAVVVGREDEPGETKLIAYLTAIEKVPHREALRRELEKKLPAHMVPAAYVFLDSLPFTRNGKFDYGKLPAPSSDDYVRKPYEAPKSQREMVIAQIWQELLRVERVGRHDNFFELGGQSLLAIRMLERMRGRNLHADVRTLFVAPSLLGLAQMSEELSEAVL
jgi:amino acid adenylation domain-containing protein